MASVDSLGQAVCPNDTENDILGSWINGKASKQHAKSGSGLSLNPEAMQLNHRLPRLILTHPGANYVSMTCLFATTREQIKGRPIPITALWSHFSKWLAQGSVDLQMGTGDATTLDMSSERARLAVPPTRIVVRSAAPPSISTEDQNGNTHRGPPGKGSKSALEGWEGEIWDWVGCGGVWARLCLTSKRGRGASP